MKKVLLATTILAASAGFAAADVTVTGSARMGVEYDGSKTDNELSFTNRVRIVFTASGETDGGLSFGATIRADNAAGGNAGNAGSVFISGAFGKISMGDVDDAFGALFGDLAGVGLTGLGDLNELSHSADGGAFGIPTATGAAAGAALDLPARIGQADLFTRNATTGVLSATVADIRDQVALAEYIWGPLFDKAAVDATALPFATASTIGAAPATNTVTIGGAFAAVGTNITATTGQVAGVYNAAALAGFTPAAGSTLRTGIGQGTVGAAGVGNSQFVLGNVGGVDYLGPVARAAYFTTGAGVTAAGNAGDIIIDTSIAVNLAPIQARALYTYALDGFGFALGASQTGDAQAYSIAASYEASGFKVALGYARADWDRGVVASVTATGQVTDVVATAGNESVDGAGNAIVRSNTLTYVHGARAEDVNLGLSYTMDNLTLAAVAQRKEFSLSTGANIDKHHTYGVSAEYKMDAIGVSAFYMQTKSDALNTTADNYGIGASYDLGGGASIVGGIVSAGNFTGGNDTKADLGVSFSF